MGSAVSAATSAVTGILNIPTGGAAGAILGGGNPLSAIGNGIGSSLGSVAQGIASAIPDIPIASQSNLQSQINANQGLANQYNNLGVVQQNQANGLEDQATANLTQGQGAINQAQGSIRQGQQAVSNAQNVNQGQGSNVNNAIGLVGQTAAGGGAAQQAAAAQLQAGTDQAIRSQQAMANSGNLSQQISGQKTAMDNAAQLQQQNALNASALQAQMAGTAQGQYTGAAAQQAGQAAQNAGLQQQQTAQQQGQTAAQQQQTAQQTALYGTSQNAANNYAGQALQGQGNALTGQTNALGIEQQALGQSGQNKAMAVGGMLNSVGSAGMSAAGLSDYNSKTGITFASGPRAGVSLDGSGDSMVDDPEKGTSSIDLNPNSDKMQSQSNKPKPSFNAFDGVGKTPFQSFQAIPLSSDEHLKEGVDKNDKVASFLDAIDPVSFKYKDADGKMGKTPGEHIGVIAQQVEKAPGGKSMIVETPEGKGIDLASAVGTLLAAAAESHNRVKELEELFKSKMEKRKK